MSAYKQVVYFFYDYRRLSGSKKLRMFYLWATRAGVGIFLYRIERMFYLLVGKYYQFLRILLLPILLPLQAYSNLEINYRSDIGPGIIVLHPSMGIVISSYVTIGANITLTGGNVIGGKPNVRTNEFSIGDNVTLGANAVVLGPCIIGNNVMIGACALVNKNFGDNCIVAGVPAIDINEKVK